MKRKEYCETQLGMLFEHSFSWLKSGKCCLLLKLMERIQFINDMRLFHIGTGIFDMGVGIKVLLKGLCSKMKQRKAPARKSVLALLNKIILIYNLMH